MVYAGQQIGNYRIIKLLGKGGFAEVYLSEHVYLKTQVALKLLHGNLTQQDIDGFIKEAQTIATLKHQHIIRILEFGIEQMMPYLVMDYAPHGTLRQRHPMRRVLPFPQVLRYVKQVGNALTYTHEHKLIHRDIKPENMLLDENDQVLLSDFGIVAIAHSTSSMQTQDSIGTVHYMAPEQLRGYPTPASDQYSLAVVVYEWLCGTRPFSGASFVEVGMKQVSEPPPRLQQWQPTIPQAIENVVLKALSKDGRERFASVYDFVQALEQAIGEKNRSKIQPPLTPTLPAVNLPNQAEVNGQAASTYMPPVPSTPPDLASNQPLYTRTRPATPAKAVPRTVPPSYPINTPDPMSHQSGKVRIQQTRRKPEQAAIILFVIIFMLLVFLGVFISIIYPYLPY